MHIGIINPFLHKLKDVKHHIPNNNTINSTTECIHLIKRIEGRQPYLSAIWNLHIINNNINIGSYSYSLKFMTQDMFPQKTYTQAIPYKYLKTFMEFQKFLVLAIPGSNVTLLCLSPFLSTVGNFNLWMSAPGLLLVIYMKTMTL